LYGDRLRFSNRFPFVEEVGFVPCEFRSGREKTCEGVCPGWWVWGSVRDKMRVKVYILGSYLSVTPVRGNVRIE
jgi:hypothetical protein